MEKGNEEEEEEEEEEEMEKKKEEEEEDCLNNLYLIPNSVQGIELCISWKSCFI